MFCRGFGPAGFGSFGYWPIGYGGGGFMFAVMGIRLLIFVALVVFAVKLFKKYINSPVSALKMLDERFAKGEMNEEEYIKKRTILSQKN